MGSAVPLVWGTSCTAANLRTGTPYGTLVSLLSMRRTFSTIGGGVCSDGIGDEPVSVLVGRSQAANCSTAAIAYEENDICSVDGANNSGNPRICSTTATQVYCSANVSNAAGPLFCSAQGNANGGMSTNNCSAGQAPNMKTPTCSTEVDSTNTADNSFCSTGPGANNNGNQCSTGSYSGAANPAAGFCSAATGNIAAGDSQNNNCSVLSDGMKGQANQCSTDGGDGNNCSTNTPNGLGKTTTTDFCSVLIVANQQPTNAQCTMIGNQGGNGAAAPAASRPLQRAAFPSAGWSVDQSEVFVERSNKHGGRAAHNDTSAASALSDDELVRHRGRDVPASKRQDRD